MDKPNRRAPNPLASILYPEGKPDREQPSFSWRICVTAWPHTNLSDKQRLILGKTIDGMLSGIEWDEDSPADPMTRIAEEALREGADARIGLSLVEGIDLDAFKVAVLAGHDACHEHGERSDMAGQHVVDPRLIAMVDVNRQIAYVYEPGVILERCGGCPACE